MESKQNKIWIITSIKGRYQLDCCVSLSPIKIWSDSESDFKVSVCDWEHKEATNVNLVIYIDYTKDEDELKILAVHPSCNKALDEGLKKYKTCEWYDSDNERWFEHLKMPSLKTNCCDSDGILWCINVQI